VKTVGTRDFLDDACQSFQRTNQPFVLLTLDGPQYNFRVGFRGPKDIDVLLHQLHTVVIPYLEEHSHG